MSYKIGDKMYYVYDEFDGCGCIECSIEEIHEDHILLTDGDLTYWIDNEDIGKYTSELPVIFPKRDFYWGYK